MANETIKQKIGNIPHRPGCYMYFNDKRQIIYVGKAKDLHNRVASYFNKLHNFKTTQLVREIADFTTIITNSEKEALILEHNLIKQHKPRYNIALTDDRHYPYIVISEGPDPSYGYVRSLKRKYLRSYGPFPEGSKAREILKMIERIYPLWRCQRRGDKPCLFYHIDQCSGACFKQVDAKFYDQQIRLIDDFFKGNIKPTVALLEKKMRCYADNLQFEEASRMKELIGKISWSISNQEVELTTDEDWDFVSYCQSDQELVVTILFYRAGMLLSKDCESFVLQVDEPVVDAISLYLQNVYSFNKQPNRIVVDENLDLSELVLLYNNCVQHPQNDVERHLIALVAKNSEETLRQNRLNNSAPQLHVQSTIEELQRVLGMSTYLHHIEMFDISNLYSENVVGGCIVYKNGVPARNSWRKYNIDISEQDDYHRMVNTLLRRYRKFVDENLPLPDLVIMDGGTIQINAAKKVYAELKISIPTIGLVKDDHHRTEALIDLNNRRIALDHHSKLFNFLTKMQDEVHDFAISQFRQLKRKNNQTSVLETVKGISVKKAQLLYQCFASLQEMGCASDDELNAILKNKTTTANLRKFLDERYRDKHTLSS